MSNIWETMEEELEIEKAKMQKKYDELEDKVNDLETKLSRTVSAAFHALLEMSAWMGIPEKKRIKQVDYLMENVTYCAENDCREFDKWQKENEEES